MKASFIFATVWFPLCGIKKGIPCDPGAIPVAVSFVSCQRSVVSFTHYSPFTIHLLNAKPLLM